MTLKTGVTEGDEMGEVYERGMRLLVAGFVGELQMTC
jgi:hypothetical protein